MAVTLKSTKASHVGPSIASEQTATGAGERPTAYSVYPGKVIRVDPVTRKLSVAILNGYQLTNCAFMADSLASLLGFTQTSLPVVGSQVLTVYTPSQSYVVGGVGAVMKDNPTVFSVPASGDPEFEVINDPAYGVRRGPQDLEIAGGYTPGKDILPGEKEFSNNMGVWLRLLLNMAQLSAGELAKVEVSLVNDMVRIVDNYFVHHNVGGDKMIWAAGGKCTEEEHFTGYGFEAEGKLEEHEELVECKSGIVKPTDIDDPVNATGRWRRSTYVGFLGDMIHTWITDPTTAVSNYAEKAERAGKYRCWVGADGMLMVQSTGGIHIQVSPSIAIPEITHVWNDPEFDIEKAFEDLDKNFLKLWGNGKDNWKDISVACWQMRSWARYITLWHSLERWNALSESGYCKVKGEGESEAKPEPTAKEKDKEEVNAGGDTPYSGSALLSIDPSGTISLVANGNREYPGTTSIIMNNGSMQIAAPGNLDIQCGGTLSFSAKNIAMKATDHIEISAIAGALWLKARSAWNALCEAGRMWLKSDFKEEPNTDYPVDGGTPPTPQDLGTYAICIDAADGRLALHGKNELTAATSGQAAPVHIMTYWPGSPINISSEGAIDVSSVSGTSMYAGSYMTFSSTAMLLDCLNAKISDSVLVTPASVEVGGIVRADYILSQNGFQGVSDRVGVPDDDEMYKLNPYIAIEEANEKTFYELEQLAEETPERTVNTTIEEVWTEYTWAYNDWQLGRGAVTEWYTYKQPPMVLEAEKAKMGAGKDLCEVKWDKCKLDSKSVTTDRTSYPWPGANCRLWVFNAEEVPALLEAAAVKDADPEKGGISNMKEIDYNFYVQKTTL